MKTKLLTLIIFIFFISIYFINPFKINAQHDETVLFISSYAPDFISFNDQVNGISSALSKKYDIQIEYMDAKRFKTAESEENFYNLLKYKVKNYKNFAGVILGDDAALKFATKYNNDLFKDLPTVFLGVSENENIQSAKSSNILGGIIEKPSIKENIELINKLYHENKNLILITGKYPKYKEDIDIFFSLENKYSNFNFKYIALPDEVNDTFSNKLYTLDPNTDVILFVYPYRDGVGKSISVVDSIQMFNSNVSAPTFTTLNYDVYGNMIGGKVIDHYQQGKEAGLLLDDIINKTIATPIYKNEHNMWMFNYSNLEKHNLNIKNLPIDSFIVNKPIPFYIKYNEIIIPLVFTMIGLLSIIIGLILRHKRNKKYQEKLELAKKLAEDANNTKSNFISTISHELRTPVTIISSSGQLLKRLTIGNNNQEIIYNTLDIIEQNSNRLIRLINNIIDIAKIDSGYDELKLENVDAISLIEDTVLSVTPFAISKNLEIVFDTNVEELIMALDTEKIERIVLNLLSNAIKFSNEDNKILVNVLRDIDTLNIVIQDFGIGISEDNLENIFDKFIQIDNSFTRYNEGSGIGLALVKSFVKLHKGTIHVNSKINEGTKFTVSIPINKVNKSDFKLNNTSSNVDIELSDIIR